MKPLLVAVLAVLAVPGVASGYASFRAPARTVYCELGEVSPHIGARAEPSE